MINDFNFMKNSNMRLPNSLPDSKKKEKLQKTNNFISSINGKPSLGEKGSLGNGKFEFSSKKPLGEKKGLLSK